MKKCKWCEEKNKAIGSLDELIALCDEVEDQRYIVCLPKRLGIVLKTELWVARGLIREMTLCTCDQIA